MLYCRLCIYCVLFPPPLPGSTWGEAGRWDGSGGAVSPLSCAKKHNSRGSRESALSHHPVTAITISPGHVTDRLLWRVAPISHSHGGVGESRRWSKQHRHYILILFGSFMLDCTRCHPRFHKHPAGCCAPNDGRPRRWSVGSA